MAGFYTDLRDLYSSKTASEVTSETYWVGDAHAITLQVVGSPSTTTIQGSNDNGRDVAITNWQTIDTLTSTDIYYVDPGFRWIRALRSETTALKLALQNRGG